MRAPVSRTVALGVALSVLVCLVWFQAPASADGTAPADAAPYIVTFRSATSDATQDRVRNRARSKGATVHRTYQRALRGFAASLDPAAVSDLRADPSVETVEPDVTFHTSQIESPAPWGLDRIDQRAQPTNGAYAYGATGAGVSAFVIDGGIRADHVEFGGRVSPSGFTTINDGRGTGDCSGHGTHVAGIIGGATFGVAKGVTLVPVRTFDCDGSALGSDIIAGIDWVVGHQVPGRSVINISAGGPAFAAMDAAVANAVGAGVPVVVAAGNDNAAACNFSPAREPSAITVGASTSGDARASFSNFGTCVDLFAPGVTIPSAWYTSATASAVLDGTSMAAPHVVGALAIAMQGSATASPAALAGMLGTLGTHGALSGIGAGSPNTLLFAPQAYRLAGVGTSTTGPFAAALGADPVALAVRGIRQIDAFAPTGGTTITTQDAATYPGCTITRPASSAAARAALLASLGAGNGCLQFAGAESLDLSAANPRLTYIPLARDNVTFAITATSNLSRNVTLSRLRDIYACRSAAALHPMLPAAGSGLREFWIGAMYGGSAVPAPTPTCLQDGSDEFGGPITPNAGGQLNDNELVPYSVAQWTTQIAGVLGGDLHGRTTLAQIDGRNPFSDGFGLQHDLYDIVPTSAMTGASLTDAQIRSVFVGSASLTCQAMTGTIAVRYGFRPHPDCGSTSLQTP